MRLKALIFGLLASVLAANAAHALDKVTFRLNWLLYGFHTPFYLGVERGYYKDEGIDLTIGEGQGSVRAVQTVGAKGDMFGLADGGSLIAGVSKGAPVTAVMAVTNSSPYSLAVRADSGIKTLKDIEGKTVASAPGSRPATIARTVRAQRRRHQQGENPARRRRRQDGRRRRKTGGRADVRPRQPVANLAQARRAADRLRLFEIRHQHGRADYSHQQRLAQGQSRSCPPIRQGDGAQLRSGDQGSGRLDQGGAESEEIGRAH